MKQTIARDTLITYGQAAKIMNVSVRTVYRMGRLGRITVLKRPTPGGGVRSRLLLSEATALAAAASFDSALAS